MNIDYFIFLYFVTQVLTQDFPFVEDENCLYQETGSVILWKRLARINFFIPFKASRRSDTLVITSDSFTLTVRNPLLIPYKSIIPKNALRFGWNTMYIENGQSGDVKITVGEFMKNLPFYQIPSGSKFRASGQFSVINCNKDQKYYWIPARRNVVIPYTYAYALNGVVDRFDLYSDQPFSLELTLNRRFKICKEDLYTYTVKSDCPGQHITEFEPKIIYNVYMYPVFLYSQDVLHYGNITFTDFTVHNLGNEGFYLMTLPSPNSNAPIWLLQDETEQSSPNNSDNSSPVTQMTTIKKSITETTIADTTTSTTTITAVPTLKTSSSLQTSDFVTSTTQEPKIVSSVANTNSSSSLGEESNVFKIVIVCCASVVVIALILGITCCVKRYRKPQQRRFETPISPVDFSTWPGLKELYVNAEPKKKGMKKTATTGQDKYFPSTFSSSSGNVTTTDQDKYFPSTFSSSSGNVTFAIYDPPSLGIGEEENYYEEYYERPKHEYENCTKPPDPTYLNTTGK